VLKINWTETSKLLPSQSERSVSGYNDGRGKLKWLGDELDFLE
jgi:hypothetical protein